METPRIYVASLSDYNAGTLHGEWIDLDGKTAEDVNAEIEAMLAASPEAKNFPAGGPAEEYAIHDFELGGIEIGEYESIETVVAIANALTELGEPFAEWASYSEIYGDASELEERFREAYLGQFESITEYAEEFYGHVYDEALEGVMVKGVPAISFVNFAGMAQSEINGGEIRVVNAPGGTVYVFNNYAS